MSRGEQVFEGIVVGSADFGEAHRIVRFLAADRGRVSVLARGARTSKKRFAGMLDPGTRLRVQLVRGRGSLWVMGDTDRLGGPKRAREELERIAMLAYACEVCGALASEEQPAPKLMKLLLVFLALLEADPTPGAASVLALEAKALTFSGLAPALVRCAECGDLLDDGGESLVFDPAAGGALHARCGGGRAVSGALLKQLERLRRTPLADTVSQGVPNSSLRLLAHTVEAHLGRGLRSRSLVDDVVIP